MATTVTGEITFGQLQGMNLRGLSLMSRVHGKEINDEEHLRQSVIDILTTRIGSRVMLGDYGCNLFEYIDRPINNRLVMDIRGAIIKALVTWEPRISLTKVLLDVTRFNEGKLGVTVEGFYLLDGRQLRIRDISLDLLRLSTDGIVIPPPALAEPTPTLGEIADENPTEYTFGFVADAGTAGTIQSLTTALLDSWSLDFLVTGGGQNYPSGAPDTLAPNVVGFNEWYAKQVWFPAAGTPELATGSGVLLGAPHVGYFNYLEGHRRYYTQRFPLVSLELFFVSTSPNEPDGITGGSKQSLWLRDALLASTARYRIIVAHGAPFSKSAAGRSELSWLLYMPKAQLLLHGGTFTTQHNVILEDGAHRLHLLDVSASAEDRLALTSGTTGYGTDAAHVWGYSPVGTPGNPTAAKITVHKQYATVTVHDVTTGDEIHTFPIYPF